MANIFERDARAQKVQRLLEAIDRIAQGVDAGSVHHWLKTADDKLWCELSLAAKTHIPSPTTRLQVLAVLERRVLIAEHQEAS